MGQNDILNSTQLKLFSDEKLKQLLGLPLDTKIVKWRDKFCIADYNATEIIDKDIPCRLVLSWLKYSPVGNGETIIRTLSCDVFVKQDMIYTASNNALKRRQDLIVSRIKTLLHKQRIADFRLWASGLGDTFCGNPDFSRTFILFEVKHIL